MHLCFKFHLNTKHRDESYFPSINYSKSEISTLKVIIEHEIKLTRCFIPVYPLSLWKFANKQKAIVNWTEIQSRIFIKSDITAMLWKGINIVLISKFIAQYRSLLACKHARTRTDVRCYRRTRLFLFYV